ncbi:MAG: hypothetical protein NW223_17815 [Hyphomicrobiaceae bacterium]|nr:hypothetical protein [Hyphomicrobiaceae bacterium]
MEARFAIVPAAGLMLLALLAVPARAAPLPVADGLGALHAGAVEKANYGRRCWRHRGRLICRRYYRPHYGPFFGFSFGGGRGWHGGGGHWQGGGHRGHFRGHRGGHRGGRHR